MQIKNDQRDNIMAHRMTIFLMFITLSLNTFAAKSSTAELTWNEAQQAYDQLPEHLLKSFSTQCGDRAHVWSYILKTKFNIDSQKVFLYFTPKSFNFTGMRWGFHVTTLITIDGEEYAVEKIPRYEVKSEGGYVLKNELMFDAPIPLKDWLMVHTGYESCKELDMYLPADKNAFKPFKKVRVYQSSDDCVIAKTPSAYWWPNSVHRAVTKGAYYSDTNANYQTASLACANIFPGSSGEAKAGCNTLLKATNP